MAVRHSTFTTTTSDEDVQIHGPVEEACDEDVDSSALLRAAAGSVTQLMVGRGPPTSMDADDPEDPLVEMARLDPITAASFVKSAMLLGGVSSGLVATLSGALLFMNWSDWAACERPLRWWLLINCQLQLTQVPLRLTFWSGVKAAEAARESIPARIAQMASTPAWRISKVVSLLTYFWMILGVVWTINAGRCRSCPELVSTVVAVLATSGARVLCAFAGFRVWFPQGGREGGREGEASQMVPATAEQICALGTEVYESDDSGESMSCAVCLSEFCDGEELRKLPCNHKFHVDCADKWLGRSKRCPLCMRNVDEVGCADESWGCKKRCKPHAH